MHRSALALKLLIYEPTGKYMLVLTEKVALRSLPFRCNRGQPDIQSARVHRWDEELVGRFPAFESRYDGRPRFTGIIGMYS